MNGLTLLEKWYSSQCNGEWEHTYGVEIDTLDNPGWVVKIDLRGTKADGRALERAKIERTENDWIQYWVENRQFHAACGPLNLSEAIQTFIEWFQKSN